MKTILILSVVCLIGYAAEAQKLKNTDVPDAVKKAFATKFPGVKEVEWSKEGSSEFEAEFEIKKVEQSANFDATGKWLATEKEIKLADLPQAVRTAIDKDFAGFKIKEVETMETPDHALLYEVGLKKDKTGYEVQYSANGTVVKKESKPDKD
jgi:hypothetical protein